MLPLPSSVIIIIIIVYFVVANSRFGIPYGNRIIIVHRCCGRTGIASIFQREMCGAQFGYAIFRHKNRGRINTFFFLVEIRMSELMLRVHLLSVIISLYSVSPSAHIASHSHPSVHHTIYHAVLHLQCSSKSVNGWMMRTVVWRHGASCNINKSEHKNKREREEKKYK